MTLTITKPTVNGSNNTWGATINTALDSIVSHVNNLESFPAGGIVMWSGTIANIPTGWNLCDGTNSTPDLTDRFIVGSTSDSDGTHDIGDTGGANSLTLTESQLPSHTHSAGNLSTDSAGAHTHNVQHASRTGDAWGYYIAGSNVDPWVNVSTSSAGAHTHTMSGNTGSTGSASSVDNRPAYYALAFIMKA